MSDDRHRRVGLHPLAGMAVAVLALLLQACFPLLPSQGGGQIAFEPPRRVDPSGVALPEGYRVEVVAEGLTFPTGVAFDDEGRVHVLEAGYAYGEVITTPRLSRLDDDGGRNVIAEGDNPPWNGVTFHDGVSFVAGGTLAGGEVLAITPDGGVTRLVADLPGLGDHHTNAPTVGPDGWLYFGQGTATNAGVVGLDNVRVDPDTGVVHDFAVNRDPTGPASRVGGGGLERPVAVAFAPDGRALYIVDFGVMTVTEAGAVPWPGTGVIWRVVPESAP